MVRVSCMEKLAFSDVDLKQMEALGIPASRVLFQVEVLNKSSFQVQLRNPCTREDGVHTIPPSELDRYIQRHRQAALQGRFIKFVPASGAATRMFQSLFQVYQQAPGYEQVSHTAEAGDPVSRDFLQFFGGIRRFAFFHDLAKAMAGDGLSLESLVGECHFRPILEYLLTERGLSYGTLPKGLLKFHRYPTESRTAFEEHLVEAAHYTSANSRECLVHFTVSPEHEEAFTRLTEKVRRRYEERYGVGYEVCFSFQKRSTDTISVDMRDMPFRDDNGSLLFRPGGHGALLENLNDLQGDLIYIKNVDNLIPDRLKESTVLWKKILGGLLVEVQETVHDFVRRLEAGAVSVPVVQEAEQFACKKLLMHFPRDYESWPTVQRKEYLLGRLKRPIRVCGVVRNTGEPGGAPFWVRDRDGSLSIQIVEKAQVDFTLPDQREIWASSTHFNPVDLVCAVRDHEGRVFDLRQYVDQEAVFISTKSHSGRALRALELPGLWNGSMAHWITLIVEVPRITFNPVKTICDLLRPEHQCDPD